MSRPWIITSAVLGLAGVLLGAFGAHLLRLWLPLQAVTIFETGVRYHLFHVLALFGVALMIELFPQRARGLQWVAGLFLSGILLFSGSLYVLAMTGSRLISWITPVGGAAWLAAWGTLAVVSWRIRPGRYR